MTTKSTYFLVFSLIFTVSLFGVEDFNIKLKKASDNEKPLLMLEYADKMADSDTSICMDYISDAIKMANNTNDNLIIGKSYSKAADIYTYLGNYAKAMELNKRGLDALLQTSDSVEIAKAYLVQGNIFFSQNIYTEAVTNYNKVLLIQVKDAETTKGIAHLRLGTIHKNIGQFKEAEANLVKSIKLLQNKNEKSIAKAYNFLGVMYFETGDFKNAIIHYSLADSFYLSFNDKKGSAFAMNNIGNDYNAMGVYDKALEYYQKALRVFEYLNLFQYIASTHNNIGIMYRYVRNNELALVSHQKAIDIARKTDNKPELARAANNIGSIKISIVSENFIKKFGDNWEDSISKKISSKQILNEFNEALNFYQMSLDEFATLGNIQEKAKVLHNMAYIFSLAGYYDKALDFYKESFIINSKIGNIKESTNNTYAIGKCYLNQGNLLLAEEYLKRSYMTSREIHAIEMTQSIAQNLASLYEKKNNINEAYKYFKIYSRLRDTLINVKSLNRINELQSQFETEKKQQQIAILEKDKELQAKSIKQKNLIIGFGVAGLLLIVVFVILLGKQVKEKQLANRNLEDKNQELSLKNHQIFTQKKEITDSINYAKRIQTALLPPDSYFNEVLPEHFIFFKPRDIVSGDFYWLHSENNQVYIAVADCTGHGVPGAFMSMMGITLLNEIVASKQNLQVNEILNELRTRLIKSLHQSGVEGENQDGMDMTLCLIDKTNNMLSYAGANNPVFVCRNGEIIELLPDKMPIGIHSKCEQSFIQKQMQLKTNDTIYSLSDGFPDQFGGPLGKKFMIKLFKELLKEINPLTIGEQKHKLETAFTNWKGEHEQIDDILVIGVKV